MKKILLILFSITLVLSSCSPLDRQGKKTVRKYVKETVGITKYKEIHYKGFAINEKLLKYDSILKTREDEFLLLERNRGSIFYDPIGTGGVGFGYDGCSLMRSANNALENDVHLSRGDKRFCDFLYETIKAYQNDDYGSYVYKCLYVIQPKQEDDGTPLINLVFIFDIVNNEVVNYIGDIALAYETDEIIETTEDGILKIFALSTLEECRAGGKFVNMYEEKYK